MFKKQIDGKLIDLKLEELNSTDEIVKQLHSVHCSVHCTLFLSLMQLSSLI